MVERCVRAADIKGEKQRIAAERQIKALMHGLAKDNVGLPSFVLRGENEEFDLQSLCWAMSNVLEDLAWEALKRDRTWGMRFHDNVGLLFHRAVTDLEDPALAEAVQERELDGRCQRACDRENDPRRIAAERQLFALVRGLENEGFDLQPLCCALCNELFMLALEEWKRDFCWGGRFFNDVALLFLNTVQDLEDMIETKMRNQRTGCKSPYQ